jgi:hypothetical protein
VIRVGVYFQANPECPFLPELQGLLVKTTGMVEVLWETLAPSAKRTTGLSSMTQWHTPKHSPPVTLIS